MKNGSELERILLTENTEAINDWKTTLTSEVQTCKTLLENLFQFENENAIPKNVDAYVWEMFLSSNEAARARASYDKIFTIRNVNLPDHIERIYSDLNAWQSFPKRDLSKFLIREKDCYSVNEKMVSESVELFAESQRLYAIGAIEIERVNFCRAALSECNFIAGVMNVDFGEGGLRIFSFNQTFKNPLIIFPKSYPEMNLYFIKSGEFKRPSTL